jgi:hypothetical protein
VFVIGDLAVTPWRNGRTVPGVAQGAIQGGRYVARVLRARAAGDAPPHAFAFRDLGELATVGRLRAVADFRRLRFSGRIAWMLWLSIHLFWLIGLQNRILVFIRWGWSFVTRGRGNRLITGAHVLPLVALLAMWAAIPVARAQAPSGGAGASVPPAACRPLAEAPSSPAPSGSPEPSARVPEGASIGPLPPCPVAVLDVVGEPLRIELTSAANIDHATRLLAGEPLGSIPVGMIVRGDPGPNAPWSWHIDPATLSWAEVTIELCDGIPSQVEDGTFTIDQFCPWGARLVAIDQR